MFRLRKANKCKKVSDPRSWSGKRFRPRLEPLEERMLLDAGLPAALVVGRTLSAYFTGDIQNNQETLTYTVYNEQASSLTGVLLTDMLQPGVTFASASQAPDQSGQSLAWNLGTISGYDRASVTLTVALATPAPLQMDAGARAFATVDAAAVSNAAPAATLRPGTDDPSLLASTPDANTTDPYIQEQAAKLNYDPRQIFDFLHTQIGFNSYVGSLRGARGTLWSDAGNALDVSSLGVALMRASGIPAQYVSGTLDQSQAQQLILPMFPASYQTVGFVPVGTQLADPANDPQLLSETESHYWFQFDAGGGMTDADPLMPGAAVGQAFTASTGTFGEVADSLRARTEITLTAEIFSQASATFHVDPFGEELVLDQTFNDVDLVGRPLSIGNFVGQSGIGGVLSSVTNTYSPYIEMGDDAFPDPNQDQLIDGTPYQEVLTAFPLGNQILTGLFLSIKQTAPQSTAVSYQKTLFDRIGYAARQGQATPTIQVSPSGPTALTDLDIVTLDVSASLQPASTFAATAEQARATLAALQSADAQDSSDSSQEKLSLFGALESNRLDAILFQLASDSATDAVEAGLDVKAYFAAPRIIAVSTVVTQSADLTSLTLGSQIDRVADRIRAFAAPGQNAGSAVVFQTAWGLAESGVEGQILNAFNPSVTSTNVTAVFAAAASQAIPILTLTSQGLSQVDALSISAQARAYVTQALEGGDAVFIPSQSVSLDGAGVVGWFQLDPVTGAITDVFEDGTHVDGEEPGLDESLVPVESEAAQKIVSLYLKQEGQNLNNNLVVSVSAGVAAAAASGSINQGLAVAVTTASALEGAKPSLGGKLAVGVVVVSSALAIVARGALGHFDPPVGDGLIDLTGFTTASNTSTSSVSASATTSAGAVFGNVSARPLAVAGQLTVQWNSSAVSAFEIESLNAGSATIENASGTTMGTGTVELESALDLSASVSGDNSYNLTGVGSLSSYPMSDGTLGTASDWTSYSTSITGSISIALATDRLTLNGQPLPAGVYTILATSATLGGSGVGAAPDFAGAASLTVSDGTVNLGSGSGSLMANGQPVDATNGLTLTGYAGTIGISVAGGPQPAGITFNGSAAGLLTVSAPETTADQNTPASFKAALNASFADAYSLSVQAPTGWAVNVDANGNVTATPASGLQSGTYPIQIVAQSTTNPDLTAQTTVNVDVSPSQPGLSFSVQPDAIFSLPFEGSEIPSGFRASIQNLGPAADSYALKFSNLPTGFTILNSGVTATVPAGQTGVLGIYLQPSSRLPAPGTQISFTVTASSTTDPSITQTQIVAFTVPSVDAIAVTGDPVAVNTTPGVPSTETITLTNAGNVAENVALAATTSAGLALTGLTPAALAIGQSVTESLTLTPGGSVALNSVLVAIIAATFGQSGTPVTQTLTIPVSVVVPGADAIANAAQAASQLGDGDLAERLQDLSTSLTNLVQNSTSDVFKSQALANLDSIISQLRVDPILVEFAGPLQSAQDQLAASTASADIFAAINSLGGALDNFAATTQALSAANFTVTLTPNSQTAQPQTPRDFDVQLHNIGAATATYDLSLSGLPADVTSQLSQSSMTLAPSAFADVTLTLTQTTTVELEAFSFDVDAAIDGVTPAIVKSATGSLTTRNQFVSVTQVSLTPPFASPGTQIDVSAQLLNSVNEQRDTLVSFTVSDPGGHQVFASTPTPLTLTVQNSLETLDLGNLDTTGFTPGQYAIQVSVTDASGTPIPGASAQASLLISSPVTTSLTVGPQQLPPGTNTVTDTLQINSNVIVGDPLSIVAQMPLGDFVSNAGRNDVLEGLTLNPANHVLYVTGDNGFYVVDTADSTNPVYLENRGYGGFSTGLIDRSSGLIVFGPGPVTNVQSFERSPFEFIDLTNPAFPEAVEGFDPPYQFASSGVLVGNNLFTSTGEVVETNGAISAQYGTVLDLTVNPSLAFHPDVFALEDELFNVDGTTSDSTPGNGGNNFIAGIALANPRTMLVATSSSTGADTQDGVGRILAVDISDPDQINSDAPGGGKVIGDLDIPGTVQVHGIAVDGNLAFAVASQGGWLSPFSDASNIGPTGNLVLATVDISDPANPKLIASQVIQRAARGGGDDLISLGNGRFAFSSLGNPGDTPQLFVVDASDPTNITIVKELHVPGAIRGLETDGTYLYTTGDDGLTIYSLGGVGSIPVTAQVQIPNGTGVAIVPNSFNVPPTQIIPGAAFDTLVWQTTLNAATPNLTFTWQTTVTALQPGEARPVTLAATVDFTSQNTPGEVTQPARDVFAKQILSLDPATQTARPGAAAAYTLTIANPTPIAVTYDLSVAGISADWIDVASQAVVPANGSLDVPVTITSDPFAALSDYGFVITASTGSSSGSVQGSLTLVGDPELPTADPDAHGIVLSLTPNQASAGPGTSASFTLTLTNTGSADDTFTLTAAGLPANVTAQFSSTTIAVPPGVGNARKVTLTLTPEAGATTGSTPFQITAASTINAGVSQQASGSLNILAEGASVAFQQSSGAPNSTLQLEVTNAGETSETYDLSLAGPLALEASLQSTSVTLASGASQTVFVTVGSAAFADAGTLNLTAVAVAADNASIQSSASIPITIPSTTGFTASFTPATINLPAPGAASFELQIENTGNAADSYTATIIGVSGPVTASLIGLDGQPTQSISLFRLPGLATGAILLQAQITGSGHGTVTVQLQSLTSSETMTVTAEVSTNTNQNIRWVDQVYSDLFSRATDSAGDAFWSGIIAGGATRTQVALGILTDPTYKENDLDEVKATYEQLLHRSPDSAGLQFWANQLNQGITLEQVASQIVGSLEYLTNRGLGTNAGFLAALYGDVLQRAGDAGGLAYFGDQLNDGMSRAQVASLFFASDEYRGLIVRGWYETLLRRAGSDADVAFWVSEWDAGVSRDQLIADFLGSAEYFGRL